VIGITNENLVEMVKREDLARDGEVDRDRKCKEVSE